MPRRANAYNSLQSHPQRLLQLFFGINIIDKEHRDQKEGKEAKNRVNRVCEAARWSDDSLIEGYKEAYDGEGENIGDELPFLLKNEGKKEDRKGEKEDSLIGAEFARNHIENFAVVKAY